MKEAKRLGVGLGLRAEHYAHLLAQTAVPPTRTEWLEAITENYLGISGGDISGGSGGRPIRVLEKLRAKYPIALHGVSLSIGSTDELDFRYLKNVKALKDRIQPEWISDHLCWTGVKGTNLHDLLPLPFTREAVAHTVSRIQAAQDFLGSRMLFENVSSYAQFAEPEMTEWEFVSEIAERAGCGVLLDLNNIYVNGKNHGFDPIKYLSNISPRHVGQFHLAGHSESHGRLIDTHDRPISEPVWALYQQALKQFGPTPTLIERDGNIPDYLTMEKEIERAQFHAGRLNDQDREPPSPSVARASMFDTESDHPSGLNRFCRRP